MRVLVCGGRDYQNKAHVWTTLDAIHAETPISCLIDGMARGADTLGAEWAAARGVPRERFPADWARYLYRAGPIRNQQMLDEGKPDLVVAFPGSRGTGDMVRRSRAVGVPVREVE